MKHNVNYISVVLFNCLKKERRSMFDLMILKKPSPHDSPIQVGSMKQSQHFFFYFVSYDVYKCQTDCNNINKMGSVGGKFKIK